jgi:ATP/maltotriose-dependent transcriptional regulator MalT
MTTATEPAPVPRTDPARPDRRRWSSLAVSANDPILASKITPPGVPDWALPRPRITKLIGESARRCPLTVVSGPAGAGKTMALAWWAAAEPGPVAWVGLDGYDNQPVIFWSYVLAALRRSGVAVPKARPAAVRVGASDHLFLLRLASALAAQDPPVTLVLDDLHLLADPTVLDGLDYVLRNAGPGMRLVVSSRSDPVLLVQRYRLVGQLAEIRAGDLAFSVSEVGRVLAQHGITLSTGSLEFLTRRTEGWAAGVRLATLYVGAHPRPAPSRIPDPVMMPQVEPLTEREREVLHHYSGLLSVAEVASELCISVNTVKSHLKSIYRKLAANRRGEAVRRARQLELI